MICSNCVNFLDLVGECCRLVNDQLQKIVGCRFSVQKLKLSINCARPGYNHAKANLLRSCLNPGLFLLNKRHTIMAPVGSSPVLTVNSWTFDSGEIHTPAKFTSQTRHKNTWRDVNVRQDDDWISAYQIRLSINHFGGLATVPSLDSIYCAVNNCIGKEGI